MNQDISAADTLRCSAMQNKSDESAADTLRSMVNWLNNTTESALDDYSVNQLLKLYAAFKVCDWDLTLDYWTERQLREALDQNIIPQWGDHERDPVYPADAKYFSF